MCLAGLDQRAEQFSQRPGVLKLTQVFGIGRGDVDRDVIAVRVDLGQAVEIVGGGMLDRGVFLLADIGADDAGIVMLLQLFNQMVDTLVVEAHPVDDRRGLLESEHARLRVARLRRRRDRAQFQMAEAELAERVDVVAVLVEPRSQSDPVRERQTHQLERIVDRTARVQPRQLESGTELQRFHRQVVRHFGR